VWILEVSIGGLITFFLGIITILIKSRFEQKKKNEEEQLKKIQGLVEFQEQHVTETKELNTSFNMMQRELILNRVDSQCAIYALRKASNGIPFVQYIEEEREKLMAEYNFRFKDKKV
jgi:hypothetical protein